MKEKVDEEASLRGEAEHTEGWVGSSALSFMDTVWFWGRLTQEQCSGDAQHPPDPHPAPCQHQEPASHRKRKQKGEFPGVPSLLLVCAGCCPYRKGQEEHKTTEPYLLTPHPKNHLKEPKETLPAHSRPYKSTNPPKNHLLSLSTPPGSYRRWSPGSPW